jgi:hypothetical protein
MNNRVCVRSAPAYDALSLLSGLGEDGSYAEFTSNRIAGKATATETERDWLLVASPLMAPKRLSNCMGS